MDSFLAPKHHQKPSNHVGFMPNTLRESNSNQKWSDHWGLESLIGF